MDRPWGRWTRLYMDEQVELRLLEVEPGGYCTLHRHKYLANQFYVVSGRLIVSIFSDAASEDGAHIAGVATRTTLGADGSLVVTPGIVHQFHADTRVVAYELNIATGPNPLDPSDSEQLGPAGRHA